MHPLTLKDRLSQTVERILKAATKEFSGAGFAGARVDEIAKVAGVNKATNYYHIGGKQALYAQVVHDLFGNAVSYLTGKLVASDRRWGAEIEPNDVATWGFEKRRCESARKLPP